MRAKRITSGSPRRPIFRSRGPEPDALVWSRDLTGRCARATAIGSDRLLVENHTRILTLSDTCIRLATGSGDITVTGQTLSLCEVRPGALIVKGALERVDLPCKGGDDPR